MTFEVDDRFVAYFPHVVDALGSSGRERVGANQFAFADEDFVDGAEIVARAIGIACLKAHVPSAVFGERIIQLSLVEAQFEGFEIGRFGELPFGELGGIGDSRDERDVDRGRAAKGSGIVFLLIVVVAFGLLGVGVGFDGIGDLSGTHSRSSVAPFVGKAVAGE